MVDPKRNAQALVAPGPFRADQIRSGDPYELSRCHAIFVSPQGRAKALRQGLAFQVLSSDPDAVGVAIDPGISPEPGTLRAPDVALGISDGRGWETNIPPLALEYADRAQDEDELQAKISELLALGTRHIWVVRLDGPRRVEVYEPGRPMRLVAENGELEAPGLLRNPVPVKALFDRDEADRVTFRNLFQCEGVENLTELVESSREEGRAEGLETGRAEGLEKGALVARRTLLEQQLAKRFGPLSDGHKSPLQQLNATALDELALRIFDVSSLDEALATP